MNVYEDAHNLARAIKASEEYKQFDALKKQVEADPDLDKMLKDFQKKQFDMQAKQLMGETVGPEVTQKIQELYQIVATNPLAAQYLQAEMRFSLMMNDVYKILGDVIGIGIGQ